VKKNSGDNEEKGGGSMARQDRRVRYTKTVLRQSLLELMRTQPIEKITVKEICLRADINRGTFYAHFASPHDLLMSIENELYEEIRRSLDTNLTTEAISDLLLNIFELIEKNHDLCSVLFSEYGDKTFLRRIMFLAHDQSMQQWKARYPQADPSYMEKVYTFVVSGCLGLLQDWIQNGMATNRHDFVQIIDQFIKTALGLLEKSKSSAE
jgi:AcrR family transcriptional regulator